jgi:hypothetical protein
MRRRRRRRNPSGLSWLFWGAGALVAYYLVKNAGKGAAPPVSADGGDTLDDPGQNRLPPQGVTD